jgi:hypothetical protein
MSDQSKWDKVWDILDCDKQDRELDFFEFLPLVVDIKKLTSIENIENMFAMCDYNGDGLLTQQEIKDIFQDNKLGFRAEHKFEIFWNGFKDHIEFDKNNKIDFESFHKCINFATGQ